MSDLSIKPRSISRKDNSIDIRNSEFFKLKKEYEKQKKEMQKSDFANSPVALEKELIILAKLKELAKKEGLSDEIQSIADREQSIYTKLANTPMNQYGISYYPQLTFKGSNFSIQQEKISSVKRAIENNSLHSEKDEDEFLNGFKSEYKDIPLDENAEKIIKILGKKNYGISAAAYIIRKCIGDDGRTSFEKLSAIKLFTDADISNAIIPQLLEELIVSDDESGQEKIDVKACKTLCDFKYMGFNDLDSLHFTRYLNSISPDNDDFIKNIVSMHKAGINPDAVSKILDELRTYDTATGKYNINNSSAQSVIRMKKALVLARNNEKSERKNPINLLGVKKFAFGDDIMIVKNGEINYISPVEGESVYNLQQQYDEMISKIEDNLLLDFIKKYKDENGQIDSKYVRILIALRHYGITYGTILNMIDMCINKDGSIDKNTMETINTLKKSGALSDDIPLILNSVIRNADSSYNQNDINNASYLSSQVTPGHIIAELLPDMRKNPNLKDFILDFVNVFEDKEYLFDLLKLIKDDNGNIDENAMDVIYNLAQNILRDDNSIDASDFLKYANNIINAAKNDKETHVNDEGAGIVAIMCQYLKSPEDIITALDVCHDDKGIIDEKLSEVVWMMCLQKSDIVQISELIDACKKQKAINYNFVDTVLYLFSSGISVEKILKYALN